MCRVHVVAPCFCRSHVCFTERNYCEATEGPLCMSSSAVSSNKHPCSSIPGTSRRNLPILWTIWFILVCSVVVALSRIPPLKSHLELRTKVGSDLWLRLSRVSLSLTFHIFVYSESVLTQVSVHRHRRQPFEEASSKSVALIPATRDTCFFQAVQHLPRYS